jgi:hypothetical protein
MTFLVQHIRSGEYARRPQPLDLAPGQLAVNYNSDSTGLYFRTDNGELVKAGPVHVGSDAPPQINWTERSVGEMWLDTTDTVSPSMKVYTEAGWVVVNVLDGTITSDKIENGAVTANKITLNNTLIPTDDDQFDLGSSVSRLSAIYAGTLNVSAAIVPTADNVVNLGTPSLRFANIYTGDLHLKNDKGDWTVIEAEEYLTLRNNKTGKTFKIVMEAID